MALADLDQALPKADDKPRAMLLRIHDDEELVDWGTLAASEDILDEVQSYVGNAVNILHGLGTAAVSFPPAILHAVVGEAHVRRQDDLRREPRGGIVARGAGREAGDE